MPRNDQVDILKFELSANFLAADFDGDNHIGVSDIEQAARLLTQGQLTQDEIEAVYTKVKVAQSWALSVFFHFSIIKMIFLLFLSS